MKKYDISKPFPILFNEAKNNITESVNKALNDIPSYMVELMVADVLHTLQTVTQREMIEAWADYQTTMEEASEAKGEEVEENDNDDE